MKMIQPIGVFLLAVMLFIGLAMEIDSYNPCSNFSQHQGECYQDQTIEGLGG